MRHGAKGLLIPAFLVMARPAVAQEQSPDQSLPHLGLSPGEPMLRSAPPSLPFGIAPATSKEYVLDFHGYLLLPARVGVHRREVPPPLPPGGIPTVLTNQSKTVLHSPPLIPQNLRNFEYTGVVPTPWLQLDFIYGNSTVSATTILSATDAPDAAGYYNPVNQLGVNDAFVSVNLSPTFGFPVGVKVGALTGRYGGMGTYDAGRYGTPLIARTNSIGETITAGVKAGEATFVLEQGLGGQLAHPPLGIVPAGWNDFAFQNVGASFVNHLHAGVSYAGIAQLGLHYLSAWTQDDQIQGGNIADGRITVLGAETHITAGRYGHLYLGTAYTKATSAAGVSGVIEVMNARGGPELISEYLGPNSGGNGSLTTFGAQYDLSLARAFFGPLFEGKSTDVLISLFGMSTKVKSDDPAVDGLLKLKGGAEVTYSALSWIGFSGRVDYVRADTDDSEKSFTIISPRVLFHTGWQSRDELALQYSKFSYGSHVVVKTGYPPADDPTANPDEHVITLSGTFWW
jgi:hypothetical protein